MEGTIKPQTHAHQGFQVRPMSEVIGAEVIGLDLSQPLDADTREAIYEAFVTYQLLVFRDQHLTKEQQVACTEQFGRLEQHTLRNQGVDDFPLVHVVSNLDAEGKPSGILGSLAWHSDKSFRPAPSYR